MKFSLLERIALIFTLSLKIRISELKEKDFKVLCVEVFVYQYIILMTCIDLSSCINVKNFLLPVNYTNRGGGVSWGGGEIFMI